MGIIEDRQKFLESLSNEELFEEVRKRITQIDRLRAALVEARDQAIRNPAMSAAKEAYWREWHQFKERNPDASLEQWRRLQKRKK
jgi:hypothetical protein